MSKLTTPSLGTIAIDVPIVSGRRRPAPNLNDLPVEILEQIFLDFIPDPPEIGETKPTIHYSKIPPDDPWYNYTRCRSTLRSLSSVSRNLVRVAQPMLYRTVAITSERSLAELLRTTIEHPEYALWIRFLSIHLTLTESAVWRACWKRCRKVLRRIDPRLFMHQMPLCAILTLLTVPPPMHGNPDRCGDIAELMVASLLFSAQKLETLMIQVPLCCGDREYERLVAMLNPCPGLLTSVSRLSPKYQYFPPCPTLSTLLMQCDPERAAAFEIDVNTADDEPILTPSRQGSYHLLFAAFPNLTTVECTWDDGRWESGRGLAVHEPGCKGATGLLQTPPKIKHLFLHDSFCTPSDLTFVMKRFPHLETLYLTPHHEAPAREYHEATSQLPHNGSLDQALHTWGLNLRELDIAWLDYPELELSDWGLENPTLTRLVSLPKLVKLEKLCVQFQLLFAEDKVLDEPLANMLPRSLVELTLEDWWGSDAELDIDLWLADDAEHNYRCEASAAYRDEVKRMLTEFARSCPDRLPKLRRVVLQSRIPSSWSRPGVITLEEQFKDLTVEFESRGVEFKPCEI